MKRFAITLASLAAAALPSAGLAQPNGALSFNANDYVQVPASPSIDYSITNAITIEAWVRRTGGSGSNTVLRRDLAPVPGDVIYLLRLNNVFAATTEIAFYLRVANVSQLALALVPTSLNAWHHFAGTYDGAAMRVYWDGALVAVHAVTGAIATSLTDVRIGAGDLTDGWIGQLDEVRLWSVARTQAQIQAFMNSTLVGNESGLVGSWRFDAGLGQAAPDSSPFGNNGQLGSTPLPDLNDPSWTSTSAPLGVAVSSIAPAFGPQYGPTPVTISGHGFVPGATTVTIGGQPLAGAVVADALTILATVPPGSVGAADLSVTAPYGSATLPNGWEWADHLHATGGVSAAAGGSVALTLFAEPVNALRLHVVATSLSGTRPGLRLPGGALVLPLNPDVWTEIGLLQANTPTFGGFFGVLDFQGQGNATFNLAPGIAPPSAVGVRIDFAYAVLDPIAGGFTLASNAVTVTVAP